MQAEKVRIGAITQRKELEDHRCIEWSHSGEILQAADTSYYSREHPDPTPPSHTTRWTSNSIPIEC